METLNSMEMFLAAAYFFLGFGFSLGFTKNLHKGFWGTLFTRLHIVVMWPIIIMLAIGYMMAPEE